MHTPEDIAIRKIQSGAIAWAFERFDAALSNYTGLADLMFSESDAESLKEEFLNEDYLANNKRKLLDHYRQLCTLFKTTAGISLFPELTRGLGDPNVPNMTLIMLDQAAKLMLTNSVSYILEDPYRDVSEIIKNVEHETSVKKMYG